MESFNVSYEVLVDIYKFICVRDVYVFIWEDHVLLEIERYPKNFLFTCLGLEISRDLRKLRFF